MARIHTDIIPTSRQKFESNMYAEPFSLETQKIKKTENIIKPVAQDIEIKTDHKKLKTKEKIEKKSIEIQEKSDNSEKEIDEEVIGLDF